MILFTILPPAHPTAMMTVMAHPPCTAKTAAMATARAMTRLPPPTYFISRPFPATHTTPPGATATVNPFASICSMMRPTPAGLLE
jgi:hypothetical protein